jgi:hypothetical protein
MPRSRQKNGAIFEKAQITICFSSKYTLQTTMTSYLIQCTKCFTLYDPAVLIAQNINTKLNKCPLCQASIKRIPKETTRQTQKLTKVNKPSYQSTLEKRVEELTSLVQLLLVKNQQDLQGKMPIDTTSKLPPCSVNNTTGDGNGTTTQMGNIQLGNNGTSLGNNSTCLGNNSTSLGNNSNIYSSQTESCTDKYSKLHDTFVWEFDTRV